MKFSPGDRVVCTLGDSDEVEKGEQGTVVRYFSDDGCSVGVRWDLSLPKRHTLGHSTDNYHGWYVTEEYLDFAPFEMDLGEIQCGSSGCTLDELIGG